MPATLTLGNSSIPFDEEIFGAYFDDEPDLMSTALIQSGAMVEDSYINSMIAGGGDLYTLPFYGLIDYDDAPVNYDGRTDIDVGTLSGGSQTGVVYGRAKAWGSRQFAGDFTAANPMQAIAVRLAKYWRVYKQRTMLGIVDAGMSHAKMKDHVLVKTELTETTLDDACEEMFGDYASKIALAVMHSSVAQFYKDKERVEYLKYTDPTGLVRELNIYQINGINTVVYNDGLKIPGTAASGDTPATGNTYATWLFAQGALRHGSAPVKLPVELGREPLKNGGEDFLVNRLRETIHPDGFTFTKPKTGYTESPTDAQLKAPANWAPAYSDANAIPI
ncbi:hypothetical protein VJ923_07280, partial [Adlercreutzia sp. R25]|uniref:hypothetical protein n=1 Tax=Adlercreutzia shanghongiae TaxID=3111773 RepID=UPI002DB6D6CE